MDARLFNVSIGTPVGLLLVARGKPGGQGSGDDGSTTNRYRRRRVVIEPSRAVPSPDVERVSPGSVPGVRWAFRPGPIACESAATRLRMTAPGPSCSGCRARTTRQWLVGPDSPAGVAVVLAGLASVVPPVPRPLADAFYPACPPFAVVLAPADAFASLWSDPGDVPTGGQSPAPGTTVRATRTGRGKHPPMHFGF